MTLEIAKPQPSAYAVLQPDTADIREVIEDNLGGRVRLSDLERVSVPAAGGQAWELPSLEGTQTAREFHGLVVHQQSVRSYWADEFSGEKSPPDCYSVDGVTGRGDPQPALSAPAATGVDVQPRRG